MTLADVLASITFYDGHGHWIPYQNGGTQTDFDPNEAGFEPVSAFSDEDKAKIVRYIEDLYDSSTEAASIIKMAAAAGGLNFGESAPGQPGFEQDVPYQDDTLAFQYIGYNLNAIDDLYYFNNYGELVKEVPQISIIHEIIHILGATDPDPAYFDPSALQNTPDFDFDGQTVTIQNQVSDVMGYDRNKQRGYWAAIQASLQPDVFSQFQVNHSYSLGNEIDINRLGFDNQNDVMDNSLRTDNSRDVMFGLGGDDILKGGGGDDYLYGGADNDVLAGGSGTNLLDGGTGYDRIDLELDQATTGAQLKVGIVDAVNSWDLSYGNLTIGDQTDKVVNSEYTRLTDFSDKVVVSDLGKPDGSLPMSEFTIDFGSSTKGRALGSEYHFNDDQIDLSAAGKSVTTTGLFGSSTTIYGVYVNLSNPNSQTIQYFNSNAVLSHYLPNLFATSDVLLRTANAKSVVGTNNDDVLIGKRWQERRR